MIERLSAKPSKEIVKYMIAPRLFGDLEQDFQTMIKVNTAHVVMLLKQEIIKKNAGIPLLKTLIDLSQAGPRALSVDPEKEDLHYNIEAYLIQQLGPEIGGQMHTGRSRNDLYATIQRMKVRNRVNHLTSMALDFRERILEIAKSHAETIMTGYTHLQPAQPITLGHYFCGVSDAFGRDTKRLLRAYTNLNLSPLGAGALATTGFAIDRRLTASLLEFGGLIENSLDAVASRDYAPEILSAFSLLSITLGRLSQDIHIWYSNEFSYMDISDEIAGTSSIMPQKKNPSPVEHVKAKAGHVFGALVSSLSCLKNTTFAHSREAGSESLYMFEEAANQVEAIIGLSDAIMKGLIINRERMLTSASQNFRTVTELADALVRECGFSFRVAHQVVGTLVRQCIERGIRTSSGITLDMLNEIVYKVTGKTIAFDDQSLLDALDPLKNVMKKTIIGGPAPAEVHRMVNRACHDLQEDRAVVAHRKQLLEDAEQRLNACVQDLIAH